MALKKLWFNDKVIPLSELRGVFIPETEKLLRRALGQKYSVCAVFSGKRRKTGAALLLTQDEYDSRFFRSRIGRISYYGDRIPVNEYSSLLERVLLEARGLNYKYLFYKIPRTYGFLRVPTEEQGFPLCGVNVDFCLDLRMGYKKRKNVSSSYQVKRASKTDKPGMTTIAADAFRRSRLYKMNFVKRKDVDNYHKRWVMNLVRNKETFVSVVKRSDKVYGFLAMKVDIKNRTGRIILIAVDKKMRGKGLGNLLIDNVLDDVNDKVDIIYVKTQKMNAPAINFYKKCGFKICDYEYGYHKELDNK